MGSPPRHEQARQAATPALRGTPPVWLLVLVTFSGTLGMHVFVPALPAMATDLQTGPAAAQLTISLYILGLAFGQLIYGPLSDCFGRRPTLLVGLGLYTFAGAVALMAPAIELLIAARLAQALGGCAGLLLGRAIVRDTTQSGAAVRRLALINLITMLGPGLAPILGSSIVPAFGWRAIFILLTALGIFNLFATWFLLQETGQPSRRLSAATVTRAYLHLLGSIRFVGFAVSGGAATTSFYSFISAAPFILTHQLQRPLSEVSLYLGLLIVGIAVGNSLAGRLAGKWPTDRLMKAGSGMLIASSLTLLVAVLWWTPPAPLVGGLMFLYSVGAGLCSPTMSISAISVDPQLTGSASGLYGFTQMAIGALCAALSGLGPNPLLTVGIVLVVASALGRLALAGALRRTTGAS